MRRTVGLILIGALVGCKSAGDLRGRGAYAQATSERSVKDLAGCIALAASGREIEIGQETLPNGVAVTAAMRPAGVKTVVNVYDIEDFGSNRRVSLYAVGSNRKSPGPLPSKVAACM